MRDFPADAERLTAEEPTGVRHVLVNGTPIRIDETQLDSAALRPACAPTSSDSPPPDSSFRGDLVGPMRATNSHRNDRHRDAFEPRARRRRGVGSIEPFTRGRERFMAVFNGVFPVLPGQEDAARAFAAETIGPRKAQLAEHLNRSSVTRETWTLQETPMGSLIDVWFEGDVESAFVDLATSDSEYITWFRKQVIDITGVDLAAPPAGPMPEVLID